VRSVSAILLVLFLQACVQVPYGRAQSPLVIAGLMQRRARLADGNNDPGTEDLEAHYEFNSAGWLADSSGNGRNLSNSGVASTLDATRGYVADFNNDNDYMEASGDLDAYSSGFTVALWVRQKSSQIDTFPVAVFGGWSGDGGFSLNMYPPTSTSRWYVWDTAVNYGEALNDNQWHHLALVYNGTTATIYKDGASVTSVAASYSATSVGKIRYGNSDIGSANNSYYGLMDDVRIYSKALTAAEVEYLADN